MNLFLQQRIGVGEEVKQWVQQATTSQRQLEEAKRHLTSSWVEKSEQGCCRI
uniref:Glial fibrillary acidic protein-like n=1 Tax=Cucumis melo TaxID=3656 RepID=A0A9I9CCK7_CUCME